MQTNLEDFANLALEVQQSTHNRNFKPVFLSQEEIYHKYIIDKTNIDTQISTDGSNNIVSSYESHSDHSISSYESQSDYDSIESDSSEHSDSIKTRYQTRALRDRSSKPRGTRKNIDEKIADYKSKYKVSRISDIFKRLTKCNTEDLKSSLDNQKSLLERLKCSTNNINRISYILESIIVSEYILDERDVSMEVDNDDSDGECPVYDSDYLVNFLSSSDDEELDGSCSASQTSAQPGYCFYDVDKSLIEKILFELSNSKTSTEYDEIADKYINMFARGELSKTVMLASGLVYYKMKQYNNPTNNSSSVGLRYDSE